MKFHKDGSTPSDDKSIFVFGSNLAGRHGAGAALVAAARFGARAGCGEGLEGRSYAIPTKNRQIKTLPLDQIYKSILAFLAVARSKPATPFFVTRIGCGLAGYDDKSIAPMFLDAPLNCSFASEWKQYLGGS